MPRWTLEQLRNLKELHADIFGPNGEAKIHIIPVSRGHRREQYGARITWEGRLYRKGLIGPVTVTRDQLESLGLSPEEAEDWAEKTAKAVQTLNRLFPSLLPELAARVKAIEESIPRNSLPDGDKGMHNPEADQR